MVTGFPNSHLFQRSFCSYIKLSSLAQKRHRSTIVTYEMPSSSAQCACSVSLIAPSAWFCSCLLVGHNLSRQTRCKILWKSPLMARAFSVETLAKNIFHGKTYTGRALYCKVWKDLTGISLNNGQILALIAHTTRNYLRIWAIAMLSMVLEYTVSWWLWAISCQEIGAYLAYSEERRQEWLPSSANATDKRPPTINNFRPGSQKKNTQVNRYQ